MSQRIALGFGNNIDYEIVWNAETFNKLIARYGICDAELDCRTVIKSERELVGLNFELCQGGAGAANDLSRTAL